MKIIYMKDVKSALENSNTICGSYNKKGKIRFYRTGRGKAGNSALDDFFVPIIGGVLSFSGAIYIILNILNRVKKDISIDENDYYLRYGTNISEDTYVLILAIIFVAIGIYLMIPQVKIDFKKNILKINREIIEFNDVQSIAFYERRNKLFMDIVGKHCKTATLEVNEIGFALRMVMILKNEFGDKVRIR